MVQVIADRVCAEPEGEIVVFLIGLRINRWWKIGAWLPVIGTMPRMLAELSANPDLGLLHARSHFGLRSAMMVQYWRSAGHLRRYAGARDQAHLPAWRAFNRAIGTNGDVGIWHETYVVPQGGAEAIYVNMPLYGLGLVAGVQPAVGRRNGFAGRLGSTGDSLDMSQAGVVEDFPVPGYTRQPKRTGSGHEESVAGVVVQTGRQSGGIQCYGRRKRPG